MFGPGILVRTLSTPTTGNDKKKPFKYGRSWQYHSRSDRHSKVACWGVVLDLLIACPLLRKHVTSGKVGLGINHEMRDFRNNKKKNLDLVICRADEGSSGKGGSKAGARSAKSFDQLVDAYGIQLAANEVAKLAAQPVFPIVGVATVLLAIEAKAAMTAHLKARPRLKDELTGSFQTIHGDNQHAIAAGLVMINAADRFISPDSNKHIVGQQPEAISQHRQPEDTESVISGLRELQRRARIEDAGFDAMGVVVVDCANDGTPIEVVTATPPAPNQQDDFDYARFINRVAHLYSTRFAAV